MCFWIGSHGVICLLLWVLAKKVGRPLARRAQAERCCPRRIFGSGGGSGEGGGGGGEQWGRAALGVDLETGNLGSSTDHTKRTSLPWRMRLPMDVGPGGASGPGSLPHQPPPTTWGASPIPLPAPSCFTGSAQVRGLEMEDRQSKGKT